MNILSFDIGGTFIKYGVLNQEGKILYRSKVQTPKTDCKITIPAEITRLIDEISLNFGINNIGISTAGQVDSRNGIVSYANYLLPNYTGCELSNIIKGRFGIETFVENDANCAALGEMWKGAGVDSSNFICLTLGTGVGGSIILNRKLYKGSHGAAGEFGDLITTKEYLTGDKHEYVYNNSASTRSLINRYTMLTGKKIDGPELMIKVKNKDNKAVNVYNDFFNSLISGLVNITYILDLDRIVIGGGISAQGDYFFDELNSRFNKILTPSFKKTNIKIIKAELENDAGLLGACYICLNRDYF